MRFKKLPVIQENKRYMDRIESEILKILRKKIYAPLLQELHGPVQLIQNSYEDLIRAVATGTVQYIGAHFEGHFNSKLSQELKALGAVFNKEKGWWSLSKSRLTDDLRTAIGTSASRFEQMAHRITETLKAISPEEISASLDFTKLFDSTLWQVNSSFEKSVKSLKVEAKLTSDQRKRIAQKYSENLQLFIQDFTEKETLRLRQVVRQNVIDGGRYESLIQDIQGSYGVSQNKAKFLARQETNLMVAQFKQTRYEDAGVEWYEWRTMHDGKVRHFHKDLDKTRHRWDDPPVVNKNGDRKNPQQDYNCRCQAIPLVRF